MPRRKLPAAYLALVAALLRESEDLTRAYRGSLTPALEEGRAATAAALAVFLSTRDLRATFTAADYRALWRLLRGRDAQGRLLPRPSWMTDLAAALELALMRAGTAATMLAARHLGRELAASVDHPVVSVDDQILTAGYLKLLASRLRLAARQYRDHLETATKRRLLTAAIRRETVGAALTRLSGRPQGRKDILPEHAAQGVAERAQTQAELVSTTEADASYNGAKLAGMALLAIANPRLDILKRWDSLRDLKVCPFCAALDGEVVPYDRHFSAGLMSPPLHPRCRCTCEVYAALRLIS